MPAVEVRSRITGAPDAAMPTVLVELSAWTVPVRELIRCTVEEQLRELTAGHVADHRAALDRQYLLDEEIRAQAAQGAVRMPRPPSRPSAPDPAIEVDRALRAFRQGRFTVFVGGRQLTALDEQVTVRLGEPVVFLRLAPLVGG